MTQRRTTGPQARLPTLALFAYIWLTLGFFAGTLTLVGPVRWLTGAMRAGAWSQAAENLAVRLVIVSLVLAAAASSALIARRTRRAWRIHGWRRAVATPTLTTVLALAALGLWMNPALMAGQAPRDDGRARFVFGPYPDEQRLKQLKDEGFTGVISLLHPAVIPFEPRLLASERRAGRAAGIRLIEAPMLPWVSENTASLARVAALVRTGTGRYYVHCYLGRDRVNLVRRLVERMNTTTATTDEASARALTDGLRLERGVVRRLDDGVFLAPYPSDEEWVGFFLAGQAKQFVSLLDPANPANAPWMQKERVLAGQHGIPLTNLPISSSAFDAEAVLRAARRARTLPRPLVVHAFLTASVESEAFAIAYRTDLPPLPPLLFRAPMRAGAPRVVGANVAVGPRPTRGEFRGYLAARGIRGVVELGGGAASGDSAAARTAGMTWRALRAADPALKRLLRGGGPWYLYGPEAGQTARTLTPAPATAIAPR